MGEIYSMSPDNNTAEEEPKVPSSIEAEQQLLGSILTNNAVFDRVRGMLKPEHFFDPVHERIYKVCRNLINKDRLASPVTLKSLMAMDEGLKELGGPVYLARLAGASIASSMVVEYAKVIVEHWEARNLIEITESALTDLRSMTVQPGDVAARVSASLSVLDFKTSGVQPVSLMSAVTTSLSDTYSAFKGEIVAGVPCGLDSLRKITPSFKPGELWLLGGRPSMGKSAVALNLGMAAARAGHPVIFASLEMRPEALAARAISEQTSERGNGVPYFKMGSSMLAEREMQNIADAAKDITHLPLWFLPREYASAELIPVGVKQALRKYNGTATPLVIVDYAQLMRSEKARGRFEEITEVSLALKSLAMSQGLPVLALSQLSRQVESREDKRPVLSDLRESGQLEQDADGVLFCYRDSYYLEREEPPLDDAEKHTAWQAAMEACKNNLDIIVAKQRQGKTGTAKMLCNLSINRIW